MFTLSPSRITSSWSRVFSGDFAWHIGVAERREIVLADQSLRGPMHRVRIEQFWQRARHARH